MVREQSKSPDADRGHHRDARSGSEIADVIRGAIRERLYAEYNHNETLNTTEVLRGVLSDVSNRHDVDADINSPIGVLAASIIHEVLVGLGHRIRRPPDVNKPMFFPFFDDASSERGNDLTIHDLIDLANALDELARFNDDLSNIIKDRFYRGISLEDLARSRGKSLATIKRNLGIGKQWLRAHLER